MEPEDSLQRPEGPATGPLIQMNQVHNLTPHFLSSILMLSSHLRQCLPSGLFPSGFPIKVLKAFLIFSTRG
jgi:hypothetical protein